MQDASVQLGGLERAGLVKTNQNVDGRAMVKVVVSTEWAPYVLVIRTLATRRLYGESELLTYYAG